MEKHGQRICALAEEAARAEDPESALRTLTTLRQELDDFTREQVRSALAAGRTFGDIARALDISRQAAHRRYRELAPEPEPERPQPLVAAAATRAAVRLACDQAIAAGEPPGSRHVLLGILATDTEAARALESEGVTGEKARACAHASGDEEAANGGDASGLLRILRAAGKVALARGDARLTPEQLLLAAIADVDGGARRTLAALGVPPRSITRRLGRSAGVTAR